MRRIKEPISAEQKAFIADLREKTSKAGRLASRILNEMSFGASIFIEDINVPVSVQVVRSVSMYKGVLFLTCEDGQGRTSDITVRKFHKITASRLGIKGVRSRSSVVTLQKGE